jgi:hypothetical protein
LRRRSLRPVAIAISVAAVAVVVFLFVADPLFDLDIGIVVDRRTASSSIVALAGRDLLVLNTLETIYKVVFPYDFVPSGLDWRLLRGRAASGQPLTAEEERWLAVYGLALDIGIDLDSKRNDFVVVTALAKIGLDLASFPTQTRNVVNGRVGPITIRTDGSVVVTLPRVVITDLVIEDNTSDDYRYPDIAITPEGWRKLAAFVSESVRLRISESRMFEEAETHARRFLTAFFNEAGYESVIFAE